MQGITVDQLAQMCLKMSAQGKGNKLVLMSSDDEKQLERLVGRILYLCSKDEINARVNQLYYQLNIL